jgi:hypothetical protein
MAGVPTISVGYAEKHLTLLDEMGLTGFGLDLEHVDAAAIQQSVQLLVADREARARTIAERVLAYRHDLSAQRAEIGSFFRAACQPAGEPFGGRQSTGSTKSRPEESVDAKEIGRLGGAPRRNAFAEVLSRRQSRAASR